MNAELTEGGQVLQSCIGCLSACVGIANDTDFEAEPGLTLNEIPDVTEQPADGLVEPCSSAGVLGPLAGVMGSMIAAETIKDITHAGRSMKDRMIVYNALEGETRTFSVERNPDCPVCGGKD